MLFRQSITQIRIMCACVRPNRLLVVAKEVHQGKKTTISIERIEEQIGARIKNSKIVYERVCVRICIYLNVNGRIAIGIALFETKSSSSFHLFFYCLFICYGKWRVWTRPVIEDVLNDSHKNFLAWQRQIGSLLSHSLSLALYFIYFSSKMCVCVSMVAHLASLSLLSVTWARSFRWFARILAEKSTQIAATCKWIQSSLL